MEFRPLGRTGLSVSAMSLGGAAFGNMYGTIGNSEARDTVHAALDAGINLIDTSPFYGKTVSETVLGSILKDIPRDRFLLSTKVGRIDADLFDFRPASIRASLHASLKRLNVDHADLLFAHDIEYAQDHAAIFADTVGELQRLKHEGLARAIGVSALPLSLLSAAINSCDLDAVISYTHFTLQNQRLLSELLPIAQIKGIGVINASPLNMGLLTMAGPPEWHPAPPVLRQAVAQCRDYCRQHDLDLGFLGMQFCLAESTIPSTISGTARRSELEANLQAMRQPADPKHLVAIQKILASVIGLSWQSGQWAGD